MIDLLKLREDMFGNGWASTNVGDCGIEKLSMIAREAAIDLGEITRGRRRAEVEKLESREAPQTRLPSLSMRYGKSEFPLHIDGAHQLVPCRYILLGCVSAGHSTAATMLQDTAKLAFTADEIELLKSGVFLVRNGRSSFYAPSLSDGQQFFRWDPGCMIAKDKYAKIASSIIKEKLGSIEPVRHVWKPGSILLLDNWRMLHGRESCRRDDARRTLIRISVL